VDRLADERRGVEGDLVADAGGEVPGQLLDPGPDAVGGVQGVGVGELEDGDARRRLPVEPGEDVLALAPHLRPAHLPHPHPPPPPAPAGRPPSPCAPRPRTAPARSAGPASSAAPGTTAPTPPAAAPPAPWPPGRSAAAGR